MLRSMDDAIDNEKRLIKRIKIKMIVFNTGMIMLVSAHCLFQLFGVQEIDN